MTMRARRHLSTIVVILATLAFLGVVSSFGFTNSEDEGLITSNPNFNPPTLHGLYPSLRMTTRYCELRRSRQSEALRRELHLS